MKISGWDLVKNVTAPTSAPLPIVRRSADDGDTAPPGLSRAVAEARMAVDYCLDGWLKGLATAPLGALVAGRKALNESKHPYLTAVPAAVAGAVGGWELGVYAAGRDAVYAGMLTACAGGNVVYEAGHVVIATARDVMDAWQRHVPHPDPGPVMPENMEPVADGAPAGEPAEVEAGPANAAPEAGPANIPAVVVMPANEEVHP